MTQARLVEVDVPGLNLLLGGGVPVLKRHRDSDESAVLLVRGPPGSGKTVLGTQLAGALARALVPGQMMDVAYGCVELLPVELAAQHGGLTRPDCGERVIIPEFPTDEKHTGRECWIYADLLALEPGKEQDGIEPAVERLLSLVERAGGKPRVVVIDSLSDGYDLGSRAPRVLADAISKLAVARGMVFILLEETVDGRPSHWSFAADVVMELGHPSEQGRAKTISITKNRFGRAEPGPHQASIVQGGRYTIRPEPSAHLSGFWRPLQIHKGPTARNWGESHLDDRSHRWPHLHNQTIAVIGTNPTDVEALAFTLGEVGGSDTQLIVRLGDFPRDYDSKSRARYSATTSLADPYVDGARLLAQIVEALHAIDQRGPLARVILGDISVLRLFAARSDITRSLMILSALLHDLNIPLILFDSSGPAGVLSRAPKGKQLPRIASFADVQIVGWDPGGTPAVTATYGRHPPIEWQGKL